MTPVILVLIIFLSLLLLFLFIRFRIYIEFTAKESGINYTIRGKILKVIKVFEVNGDSDEKGEKSKRSKKASKSNKKKKDSKDVSFPRIIRKVIEKRNGKLIHIEKLSVDGTFSIEDAAANALLHGLFLTLWQFLVIFLAANFSLEHQSYNFLPDFQKDRNEIFFCTILRVESVHMVLLVLHILMEARKKKA
ncbi:MAG: hypothetical protein KBA53_09045 [Thermoclostridium sp.]|nr:hypothetical protein [Thermoclostridium sp.]